MPIPWGIPVCLLSRIGEDDLGREALEMLKKLAVTDKYVQMDPVFPTGYASVRIGSEGRPDYLIAPDLAFDHIEITPKSLIWQAVLIAFVSEPWSSVPEFQKYPQGTDCSCPQALKFLDLRLRKTAIPLKISKTA